MKGRICCFGAEFDRRGGDIKLSLDGKTVHKFATQDPSDSSELPYVFTKEGQKFIVVWKVTDLEENFDLAVNGGPYEALPYRDPSRELNRSAAYFFKADLHVNNERVTFENHPFEYC